LAATSVIVGASKARLTISCVSLLALRLRALDLLEDRAERIPVLGFDHGAPSYRFGTWLHVQKTKSASSQRYEDGFRPARSMTDASSTSHVPPRLIPSPAFAHCRMVSPEKRERNEASFRVT
jgi:hypothetical protein